MLSAAATEILAIAVLAAVLAGLLAAAAVRFRTNRFTLPQAPLMALNLVMTRVLWRTRVRGAFPLRPGRGAVIVCNHRSPIDPAFVALVTDRIVHWMVAKEFYLRLTLSWFFRICRSIPVSRAGMDTAGTRLAIRYAREGGLVGIFPEGRLNTTDRLLLPGRPGAAMIALRARVPVVPCYLSGTPYDGTTFGWLRMAARAELVVGPPVDVSEFYGRENDREVLEELTRRFLIEIAKLAGQPDYQPGLAGRFYKPAG